MLSIKDAVNTVKKHIPDATIESMIVYNGLYIFRVSFDDELEGDMDPFYSVNIETGEFRDFSVLTDGNFSEIMTLFEKTKLS